MGAQRRAAKDALFEGFATVGKALASGRRIEILDVLSQAERSVEELAAELGQSVANTSHHLRALASAGLVRFRREGIRVYYRLASDEVHDLWQVVQKVGAEHVAEVERLAADYLGARQGVDVMPRAELLRRMRRGGVTVIDVRPAAEYRAGHILGARSIPPVQLHHTLGRLPKTGQIVAYCRGPYCVYADDAVRELRRRNRDAARLEDGFPEWRRAGLPVESS